MKGPKYRPHEREIVAKYYPIFGAPMLAKVLRRPKKGITQLAGRMGLRRLGRRLKSIIMREAA